MPSTAARSTSVLSAFGTAVRTAVTRSENFAKSDQVLPVKSTEPLGKVASGASFCTSVCTLTSAPPRSSCEVGLSTWRSMSTWYAASAVLYGLFDGRSSRCSSAGTSEHAANSRATMGMSVRRRITLFLFTQSRGREGQRVRRPRPLRAFLDDQALGTAARGWRPRSCREPSPPDGSTCSRRSAARSPLAAPR